MSGRNQPGVQTRGILVLAGGALVLLALGAAFATWAFRRQDHWLREDLLYQTRQIAQTLHLDQIQRLNGIPDDESKPEYRRLKEQLMAAQQINPAWQWIYLMGRRTNGTVFFQLDSEAYDVPDPSPPGQAYEEASELLHGVFDTRQSAVEGPLPDRWGVWVSAFVPLTDPVTGDLVTVVGIDIEASRWTRTCLRAMRVPLSAGAGLLAIWLGGAFLLARRARPGTCRTPLCRHLESILATATGLTLTLTTFWLVRQTEVHNQKIAFRHLASIEIAPTFDAAKEMQQLELESLASFFENSADVTAKEFRRFTAHLSGISEVLAWTWAEAIMATNRAAFEADAVRRTGKLDYQIWEKDAQGLPVPARARPKYLPIVYMSPKKGNQPILGFDFNSDPVRRAAVEIADRTHLPTASDPVDLLSPTPAGAGIFIARPLFTTNDPGWLRGVIAVELKIDNWLRASRAGNPDRRPMAVLDLYQLQAGRPPLRLGMTTEHAEPDPFEFRSLPPVSVVRPLLAYGKTYAIVAHPSPEFLALHRATTAGLVMLAGLVLTGAIAGVLGLFAHRREDLARLVEARSSELIVSMDHYHLLARQNRVITWELDLNGVYTHISDMSETVLGYRPDEIIDRMHFYDLCPEDSRAEFKRAGLQTLRTGRPISNRVNALLTKSGQLVWLASSGIPIRDNAGNLTGYWGTDTDITERKRAEDELARLARENQKAAARYATLISASNTGAWEYHDDTSRMWASPEYFAMLGLDPARFLGPDGCADIEQAWLELLHPNDRARARQDFVDYMRDPTGIYQHSFRMRHAGGHWVWILSRGRMVRDAAGRPTPVVVGTHIDITATKQIEEALRESERKYRTLFTEMLEGFALHEILLDAEGRPADYRFLDVNPAFERMTGLQADALIGRTVLEVMPGTERKWIETYGQVVLTGHPVFFDSFSAVLNRHFEITAFRPAPGQFACIFTDITERKRGEDELRESRRQYAALMASLPGMAYRCKNDPDWTMEFVSQGARGLTGYSPEDLVGNRTISYNQIIVPAFRQLVWDEWQHALRERRPCTLEYQITTRDDQTKWVWEQGEGVYDAQGQVLAIEGFISDITGRKQADAERERLTRAIEQSTETVVITDANGTILYVNPEFTKATGYSREDALGRNPRLLQSGWHDKAFYRAMWKTLREGRTWEGQLVNKRKDGSLFTEQAAISPVRDAAGQIVHFVAVKRDITDQLRIQKEKEDLQTQLLHAQKMESIGRLAGGVAHDFNNMLQAILGYCEMALELAPPGETLHADLKEIQKAAQRSAALTRQLQIFARKQAVMPREINLNDSIEGMLIMLQRLIGEEIQLVWRPAEDLHPVKIDPGQIDQILANLCLNSRDAIRKSGQIVIATAHEQLAGEATHMTGRQLPAGEYVVLSVQDDGCGMAPEVLEHIFEPFFTTKAAGKGTGLGLAIVYGIVTQNGGGIQVQSAPGAGTLLKIYLPPYVGTADFTAPGELEVKSVANGETILVVEDEETILQTTRRMLESLGYRVLATPSPKEALDIVRRHNGNIDLLITDVIMKDMTGPELVQELLAQHPGLHHLYMSGYAANLLARQGVGSNRLDFIQKPFSRAVLAKAVQDALHRA